MITEECCQRESVPAAIHAAGIAPTTQCDAYKTEVEELGAPSTGLTKCLFELGCVDHARTLSQRRMQLSITGIWTMLQSYIPAQTALCQQCGRCFSVARRR